MSNQRYEYDQYNRLTGIKLNNDNEVAFHLIFTGTKLTARAIELFASGYEAPAEKILKITPVSGLLAIPQHPDGFQLMIQLV